MTAIEARKCITKEAPANWATLYAAAVNDYALDDLGSCYGHTLQEALQPLKTLGFHCRRGNVGGTIDGKPVIVTVFYNGQVVNLIDVDHCWAKIAI
jgi:hypothetical protein